jgi:hypothetical protein
MAIQGVDDILQAFAAKLLEEKKIENVDPEVSEQLKADLVDQLEDRMNVAILNHMPEDRLSEFDALLEEGSAEAIQAFVRANVPDLQNALSAELLAFRKTYLGLE